MRFIVAKDYMDLSRKAGGFIFSQISLNPNSVLGLATGSSPIGVYEQLIKWYELDELDFSNVKAVNLDEYVGLSNKDTQSYSHFMHENLFSKINIKNENTHIPNGKATNIDKECDDYESLICSLGGIDMQLLGIGQNGHIGFNEPNDIFNKHTHLTGLTESTIKANERFFDSYGDVPKSAISMGIKTIMAAKKIVLIASGESKSEIVYESFFGNITPKVPASVLQLHPDVTIIVDELAYKTIKLKSKT